MQTKHKVPIHMSHPDRVVFGLTIRQFLLLLLGSSMSYNFWLHGAFFASLGMPGQILRAAIALIPGGSTLAVAFIAIAGRPLEVWLLVLVRYWQHPRLYLWRSVRLLYLPGQRTNANLIVEDSPDLVAYRVTGSE